MAGGFDHGSPQRNLNLFESIAKFNGIWRRPLGRSQFSIAFSLPTKRPGQLLHDFGRHEAVGGHDARISGDVGDARVQHAQIHEVGIAGRAGQFYHFECYIAHCAGSMQQPRAITAAAERSGIQVAEERFLAEEMPELLDSNEALARSTGGVSR